MTGETAAPAVPTDCSGDFPVDHMTSWASLSIPYCTLRLSISVSIDIGSQETSSGADLDAPVPTLHRGLQMVCQTTPFGPPFDEQLN